MKIGFISTRLAGTDGVSLETAKMAAVLQQLGHEIFYCAGELDNDFPGLLAEELHFEDPLAKELADRAFSDEGENLQLLAEISKRARQLKKPLLRFISSFQLDYIIVQNAFAIPMQLPLAQALAEVLQECNLPGLAHNHDLYWERERFQINCIKLYLETYFPPDLPLLQHAVINSIAQEALKKRKGLESILIPNVFDFENPAPSVDDYNADFRQEIGLKEGDKLILQPTRVVPRKGIELSIELLAKIGDSRNKLVITHQAGDEGHEYLRRLQNLAEEKNVDLLYVADRIDHKRGIDPEGRKIYALWDSYVHADLVTYPSIIEGFGNALIETIYFRLPALVNRYPVYIRDIAPKGFQFVEIDGKVTDRATEKVRSWLQQPESTTKIVEQNFQLGKVHYSYQTVAGLLQGILSLTNL